MKPSDESLEISEISKNSLLLFSNQENKVNNEEIDINKLKEETIYTENILKGCDLLTNHEFQEALNTFKKALSNSKKLKDEYKYYESNCYIGITQFYMEKINESLNTLEKIYNPIFEKCVNEKFSNNTKNFQMLVKIGANLSLVYFALNKCNDASTLINNIIAIIEKEVSLQKQLSVIQTFIFILFKVDTLRDKNKIKESYFNYDNDLNDSHKEDYKSIVKTLMNGFNNYLRDGIIDNWINVLKKVFSKMEHINDYKGLIFILFNQEASKYMKESSINYPLNNNNLTESKNKISSLIFSLKNNIKSTNNPSGNNKILEEILDNFKTKMSSAHEIYLSLYNAENRIIDSLSNNNNNEDNDKQTSFFLQLMIKYALNEIYRNKIDDDIKNRLIGQLKDTLTIINDQNYNLSNIKLDSLDIEISQNIHILFENLIYIYSKCKLLKSFKILKEKNAILKKNEIWNNFSQKKLNTIVQGSNIIKINFTSNGKKEHFYKIDTYNDIIKIFETNKNNTSRKNIEFKNICKITFGIKSRNLIQKKKILSFPNQPYFYLSIIEKKRSLDFEFNKIENCKNWFYGFHNYLINTQRKYKIISVTGFIINNLKMKMNPSSKETFVKLILKKLKTD